VEKLFHHSFLQKSPICGNECGKSKRNPFVFPHILWKNMWKSGLSIFHGKKSTVFFGFPPFFVEKLVGIVVIFLISPSYHYYS